MGISGVAVAALVVGAAASVSSAVETKKGVKSQKKAQKLAQRQADISAARGRREELRQSRILRAEILSRAASTGAAGSSSETGAIGSIQSQLGANLGQSFRTQELAQQQSSANISAASSQGRAATFGAIGDFASTFRSDKTLFKTFKANTQKT